MEFIKDALEKIETEAVSVSGQNVPAIAIYNYLKHKITHDEEFAKQVLIPTKALSKCFSYLTEKAYEVAKAQFEAMKSQKEAQDEDDDTPEEQKVGVGMSDKEIFGFVNEYFALDDAEIERKKEEARLKAEADLKAAEDKRKADLKASEDKRKADAALKATKAKAAENTKKMEAAQVSFFGESA